MTGSKNLLKDFKPSTNYITVIVADGKVSRVTGIGSAIYDDVKLNSVLYVPNLRFNLMSVIKLLKDQNCIVTCFPTHC